MTIREIAAITGLSPATVYRVLKDPSQVRTSSYNKVLSVVGEIKKNPEKLTQVYIVLPHINNFYTAFLVEAITLLVQKGIQAIPFITQEDRQLEREFLLGIPFSQRIGLIWNPTDTSAEFPFLYRKKNKPVILTFNRNLDRFHSDLSITLGNREAMHSIVDILAAQSNNKLLLINSPSNWSTAEERLTGFMEGVKKYPHLKWEVLLSDYSDWRSTYRILHEKKELLKEYDAIISANEAISYGIIKACAEFGISIPLQLRFMGVDYAPTFDALSMSVVYFSPQSIAKKAVELLIRKSGDSNLSVHQVFMPQIQLLGSEKLPII